MKKITFLTFIFAAVGLFLVSIQTVKAADVCHCAGANKNIINLTSDILQRLTSADLCNQECSSKGYSYYIYADSGSASYDFIPVAKSSSAVTDNTKGCCRYISRGSGQWTPLSNFTLGGCKTYGATTTWEFYPGDTTSDCSNPNGAIPISGSPSSSSTTASNTATNTNTVNNNNCTCANGSMVPYYYPSVGNSVDLPSGAACEQECANRTAKYYKYSGGANKDYQLVTKNLVSLSDASMCPTPCTSTQDCKKAESGVWKCFDKSTDKCGGKCATNSQECREAESGVWKCFDRPIATTTDVASNTGNFMTIPFKNPLKFDTVQEFAGSVLDALRKIIVVLSIIFIVIGGIMYIVSIGNEKRMTTAKGAITASMIGLALGIAAPSFLKEIYTVLGAKSDSGIDTSGLIGPTLSEIALRFLDFLLAIVGVLALIMLIIGGMMYLTSAGEEKRIETGRKIITWAIVGIAISLAALVIVKQIANLLK